jgi:hypothetical protein
MGFKLEKIRIETNHIEKMSEFLSSVFDWTLRRDSDLSAEAYDDEMKPVGITLHQVSQKIVPHQISFEIQTKDNYDEEIEQLEQLRVKYEFYLFKFRKDNSDEFKKATSIIKTSYKDENFESFSLFDPDKREWEILNKLHSTEVELEKQKFRRASNPSVNA